MLEKKISVPERLFNFADFIYFSLIIIFLFNFLSKRVYVYFIKISMKKIIYKNFLRETSEFFILSSCAVTIIVWVIQAVNYLEFVTEDGHSFRVYFLYTLYSLPKIFSKLLPFMFFFSIFFTLIKYEEQNQTLIFWTNGIKRLTFLNVIIGYSLLFLLLNILFSLLIVPYTQDKARSFIRD